MLGALRRHPQKLIAAPLAILVTGLFVAPYYFVSRGGTVAGDRQKESAEHILQLNVNEIQRKGRREQ